MKNKVRNENVGLSLLIENPGSADAVLPLGWCITPKTLETIERQKIINPHLLILLIGMLPDPNYSNSTEPAAKTIYSFYEEQRLLLPLKQGMEYIEISRPGKYRLFATIVGDRDSEIEDLRYKYLGEGKERYVERNGDISSPNLSLQRAVIDVEVGAEFFAHEPAEWEKRWVGRWLGPAKDQCQFGQQRIFAYSAQPLLLALGWLLVFLTRLLKALLLTIGGYRKVNWLAVARPDKKLKVLRSFDPWDSVFLTGRDDSKLRWFLVPLWPYLSLFGCLLIAFAYAETNLAVLLWLLLQIFLWVAGVGLVGSFILSRILQQGSRFQNWLAAPGEREQARMLALLAEQRKQLSYLGCDSRPKTPTLKAIPHPTLHLRYQALKASVCRPFSR